MLKSRISRVGAAAASLLMGLVLVAPAAMAYPPNPTAPKNLGSGVWVVSQAQAAQVTPRKIMQPAAHTLQKARTVEVRRGKAVAFIWQHLRPNTRYQASIRVAGSWETLGNTRSDAKGMAALPVFRIMRVGNYPLRLDSVQDPRTPLFIVVHVS